MFRWMLTRLLRPFGATGVGPDVAITHRFTYAPPTWAFTYSPPTWAFTYSPEPGE